MSRFEAGHDHLVVPVILVVIFVIGSAVFVMTTVVHVFTVHPFVRTMLRIGTLNSKNGYR
jgi:hypothetical protein